MPSEFHVDSLSGYSTSGTNIRAGIITADLFVGPGISTVALGVAEDGNFEGFANTLNFTGAGVSVFVDNGRADVTITGGGSTTGVSDILAGTGIAVTNTGTVYTITNTGTASTVTPGGSDGSVQYNSVGSFEGDNVFTYDPALQLVSSRFVEATDGVIAENIFPRDGIGDNLTIVGGNQNSDGASGGTLSLIGGEFSNSGPGVAGTGGNVIITGGAGDGGDSVVDGGNVVISGGAAQTGGVEGTVQISDISVASATTTYSPTSDTDLATKIYVDTRTGVVTYADNAGISSYADVAGIATVAEGLTGVPNINVGIITASGLFAPGTDLTGITTNILAGAGITILQDGGNTTIFATGSGIATEAFYAVTAGYATASGIASFATGIPTATSADLGGVIVGTGLTIDPFGNLSVQGSASGIATYFTDKGDLLTSTSAGILSALPRGSDGLVLTVNSSNPTGLEWAEVTGDAANGGQLLLTKNQQNVNPSTRYRINYENIVENTLSNLSYNNGIFTNNTDVTRTYHFSHQATYQVPPTPFGCSHYQRNDYDVWFQKNSHGGFDGTNAYGVTSYANPSFLSGLLQTEHTFTLEPGESVSCWMYIAGVVDFGCSVPAFAGIYGNNAPYATKCLVTEIPALFDAGLPPEVLDARSSAFTVTAQQNTLVPWPNIDQNNISSLTASGTNNTRFTNTGSDTKLLLVNFSTVWSGTNVPIENQNPIDRQAVLWIQKNGLGSTNRFGENVVNNVSFKLSLSTTTVIQLAPNDFFECYMYVDTSSTNKTYTSGGAYESTYLGIQLPANYSTRLNVVEITAPDQLFPGQLSYTVSNQAYTANSNYTIDWNNLAYNSLSTLKLAYDSVNNVNYFKNISNQSRTYVVAYEVSFNGLSNYSEVDSWIQYNSYIPSSNTNRIGQVNLISQNTTAVKTSVLVSITLHPGDGFITKFFANVSGTIGAATFGDTSGTKINIYEVTAVPETNQGITGVVAGEGLEGGGLNGVVTLSIADQVVKPNFTLVSNNFVITGLNSTAPNTVSIYGAASEASGANGGNVLVQGGGKTTTGTCGNVIVEGGNGNSGTNASGGSVIIRGGRSIGTGSTGAVQISDVVVARAATSYVPTNDYDFGTKTYIDNLVANSPAAYADVAGIATFASIGLGLTSGININAGVITATDLFAPGVNLSGIPTTIIAGAGVTIFEDGGNVTIYASGTPGVSTEAIYATIAGYSTNAGISSYSNYAGISTFAVGVTTATDVVQGGVKVGAGLSISLDGVLSTTALSVTGISTDVYEIDTSQIPGIFTISTPTDSSILLPSSATVQGKILYIKDVSGINRTVEIEADTSVGETIDGENFINLYAAYNSYTLLALPNGWGII